MKLKSHKGFTLIELLVVVAIIGILASVVLAALGSARGKAVGAKIEGQLSQMRAQAEIYYSTNGNYASTTVTACSGGMFNLLSSSTTSGMKELVDAVDKDNGGTGTYSNMDCKATSSTWAVASYLSSGGTGDVWCVDSNGASKKSTVLNATPTTAISSTTGLCA